MNGKVQETRMRWLCGLCAWLLLVLSLGGQAWGQSRYSTSEAQEIFEGALAIERRAEQEGSEKLLAAAAEKYEEALQRDPTLTSASVRLGYIYYVLKRSDEAVRYLREALKHAPNHVELEHYLGLHFYLLGRTDEALVYLERVVRSRQDLPEAFFVLGKVRLEEGVYGEAKGHFERYQGLMPNDPQGHRALVAIYLHEKDFEKAQASLSRLVALEPNDLGAHINLGHVRYAEGDMAGAIASYERALELGPRRVDVQYDLASVRFVQGEYARAESDFAAIVRANPTHLGAAYYYAESLLRQEKLAEARAAFQAVLALKADYAFAKLKLADIAWREGDEAGAVRWLNEALAEQSMHPDVLSFAGVLYRRVSRLREALELHSRWVELEPDAAPPRLELGRDYLALRRYPEAVAAFEAAVERDPAWQAAWVGLSMAILYQGEQELQQGNADAARRHFLRALEMDVHALSAQLNLAQSALRQGQNEVARDHLREAAVLAPNDPGVARLEAHLLAADGQHRAALRRLEPLRREATGMTAAAWYTVAVSHANLGEMDAAQEAMVQAEALGYDSPRGIAVFNLHLGMSAARAGDWRGAERYFDKARPHAATLDDADRVRLDYGQAVIALRAKRYTRAQKLLETVRADFLRLPTRERRAVVSGGDLDVSFELAYTYYRGGAHDAAIDLLSGKQKRGDVLALEQAVREQLAYNAYQDGRSEQALEQLERVAKGRQTASVEFNLAALRYGGSGQAARSAKVFERFASRDVPEGLFNYAIYLDETGAYQDALRYLRRYVSLGGAQKGDVEKSIEIKERVFGSGGGK